jgi:hypothetical protein
MPSAADLIFAAMLSLLIFTPLSVRLLGDAGIGWHIRTGQQILSTHAVPRVDPFSAIMRGRPWFAWEWFYDVAVGWLEWFAGLNGVVLLTAVLGAVVSAGTFRLQLRRGTNVVIALALTLLAASASMIHFLARPHVVSWLLTLVWFWILDATEAEGSHGTGKKMSQRWLWLLPVLMLLWVNVHGGFLVGFVLLGIYLVGSVCTWARTNDDQFESQLRRIGMEARIRILAMVSVVAATATLVNPYGWRLHVHIYQYLSNPFLMNHIEEFLSPNFHGVAEKCFAALLLIAMTALTARGRELRASELLVVLFAAYSGLYASRNLPVASLLLAVIIGPPVSRMIEGVAENASAWAGLRRLCAKMAGFSARMARVELGLRGHVWAVMAVVFGCVIALHGGRLGSKTVMHAHFGEKRFPVEAVQFIANSNDGRPVLVPDYWGGYVIYRLYPRVRSVIDDRHDFYGEALLKSYLKCVKGEPEWEEFLKEYQVQRVLVLKGSTLDNLLREKNDEWKVEYEDQQAVLLDR